ncbi:MAG: LLM class flavin-dependent oxidoreductase, partial [Chloroflexi bacterium]|nr:LLM class flavin-dependent oxidoreductase [Chloroflexota bacterium]
MNCVGLILDSDSFDGLVALAKDAEDASFDSVWATELYRTSFQQLAAIAPHTSKIKLGTAVALAFVRSPLITALTSMDLDESSGGRLILGLGSGAKRTNELWHGIGHGKPVTRIKECIDVIRMVIEYSHQGNGRSFKGEYYDIELRGYHRAFAPLRTDIPIFLAGIGGEMTKAAGAVADGYIGHVVCSYGYLSGVVIPQLKAGLASQSRNKNDFTIASIITCAISSDRSRAREAARRTIAFYATVKTYDPPFKLHGFQEQAQKIRQAFFKGHVESMAADVTDEMVDTFA